MHRSRVLMTVRPLAISCASREFMGGAAAPRLKASPIPRRAWPRGLGIDPVLSMTYRHEAGCRETRGPWRGGLVTEILDRRQRAVRRACVAGLVSPSESPLSCDGGPSAARRQMASRGDQRQGADVMSRVSLPNIVFRSGTVAAALPHCLGATCKGGKSRRQCGGRFHVRMAPDRGFCPAAPIRVDAQWGRSTSLRTGVKDVRSSSISVT